MITFGVAQSPDDLQAILNLQQKNLPVNISTTEAQTQGFVTVHHDFDLLERMNQPYPHIVVRDKAKVVGYALVMMRRFKQEIPVLVSMFDQINAISYQGHLLGTVNYFIMGQVCIDKAYRGLGLFAGLYEEMKKRMSPHFDYIVTEVALRNRRSMRAHEKIGFEKVHTYKDGEDWQVLLWPI